MNFITLLIVAFGGAFSIVWLIHYIPLISTIFGKKFSPRLFICKTLGPFDAVMTIILVAGAWAGIGTAVTGIGMMVYNVMTGIGLSMGVLFTKKVLKPRWEKTYKELIDTHQGSTII
jgi:hypothetical protein